MNRLLKMINFMVVLATVAATAGQVVAAPLHGNAAEDQAVREMKGRLQNSFTRGDINACRREGDNLARYGKARDGEALIRRDINAIQRKLDAYNMIYKGFYDLRTLYNRKSVKQAYQLIAKLRDKFVDDAATNVTFVFLPAPLGESGRIAGEFFKAAVDTGGNVSDAGEIRDSATALRHLDRLVKGYDAKMQRMIPDIRKAQGARSRLLACEQAFREGASQQGGSTGQRGGSYTAEKGKADSWSHIRVTVGNVTDFKATDSPGWRNNGTSFKAVSAVNGQVPVKVVITCLGKVSYFDYTTDVLIKTSDGKTLLAERPVISKDGGTKTYSAVWNAGAAKGGLTIRVSVTGGNPEYFTYYVSGTVVSGR
jgi:hypothetical protein